MATNLLKVKKSIKSPAKKFEKRIFSSSMIRLSGFNICHVYEKKLTLGSTEKKK